MVRIVFVLILAAVLAALLAGCGKTAVDRGDYVKKNQSLFRELPRFPGSQLKGETSTPGRADESGPIVGYATRYEISLPPGTHAAAVAAFYRERLEPEWQLVEELDGPVLNFRRGRALVSINLESGRSQLLEIGLDHAGYGDGRNAATVDERAGVVAGVSFGDTADTVRRHLGQPSDDKPGFFPAGADYTGPPSIPSPATDQRPPARPIPLHYTEMAFLVSPTVGVFSMATLADGARTHAGVAVGDDLDRVRERYKRVTCGEQTAGEPVFGGDSPRYRWCRTVVARVRVFFGGDPIQSIALTRYPPKR